MKSRVEEYLLAHGCQRTWEHSQAVAEEALYLAREFGVDEDLARQAAWLHDISAVILNAERLAAAQRFRLEVLPEEATFPMILHQKLSAALARQEFGIQNEAVLGAIGCHTTLKADFTPLDLVLFVADKLAWDQPGQPPYAADLCFGLRQGLEQGALAYLDHLWQRREELGCVHPWMVAAREALNSTTKTRRH